MTVAELIQELEKVEDKSLPIICNDEGRYVEVDLIDERIETYYNHSIKFERKVIYLA